MKLRDFATANNVTVSGDFFNHSTASGKVYRIYPADTAGGNKILFIPSQGAVEDHENGVRKLGDCEVVNDGITAKDGTPILFLHKPAQFAGHSDLF